MLTFISYRGSFYDFVVQFLKNQGLFSSFKLTIVYLGVVHKCYHSYFNIFDCLVTVYADVPESLVSPTQSAALLITLHNVSLNCR